MKEIQRLLADRYTCLFVDLQKAANAADAIVEISMALRPHINLWAKTKTLFANAISTVTGTIDELNLGEIKIKLRAGLTTGNWTEKGDSLFSILAHSDRPVLLLIDEVPLMVNRMLKGDDFTITPERKATVDEFIVITSYSIHYTKLYESRSTTMCSPPTLRLRVQKRQYMAHSEQTRNSTRSG